MPSSVNPDGSLPPDPNSPDAPDKPPFSSSFSSEGDPNESMQTLWYNVNTGDYSDPNVKSFMENMKNQISSQINRDLKKSREALKKIKEAIDE